MKKITVKTKSGSGEQVWRVWERCEEVEASKIGGSKRGMLSVELVGNSKRTKNMVARQRNKASERWKRGIMRQDMSTCGGRQQQGKKEWWLAIKCMKKSVTYGLNQEVVEGGEDRRRQIELE